MARSLTRLLRRLLRAEHGSVAAYAAVFAALSIASGAVAIDFGRMTVLRTQMQDRADAGAMAGAAQLDGRADARVRAQAMAVNAIQQSSGIPGDGTALAVDSVNFYSVYEPDPVAATSDLDAKFIEVVLTPRQVDLFFAPLLNMFSGGGASAVETLEAIAVAGPSPFICEAPPLMICDLGELDPTMKVDDPANIGRQVRLKEPQSGSPAAPGNFGLLALPDGSTGAEDIKDALAAVTPADCYTLDVTTATGSKTNKVKDGINARFDLPGGLPEPAPDVINLPKDLDLAADTEMKMGDGNWDPDGYWSDKHDGQPLPTALDGASRYQTYLYELGLEFARNGKKTIYPIEESLPEGYTTVTPPTTDIPAATIDPFGDDDGDGLANEDDPDQDGVPSQTVASNGFERRLMRVAVLQCQSDDVHGHGTFPTNGNYILVFITEQVRDPPDAAIYAEIVKPLSQTSDPEYHANVRLIR